MSPANLTPIYTQDNCQFSAPLMWGVSIFWREPTDDNSWLSVLSDALKDDGIRILGHRFSGRSSSQFAVSTTPEVAPVTIVQRVKGRLQHVIRESRPKALRGNYAIRGFGKVTRAVVENYVATQLDHHQMADPKVQTRLERFQVCNTSVDLSIAQKTSHGRYWYNLHVVLVHQHRWFELRDERLEKVRDMIVSASRTKGYRLSRAGVLPDHIHLTLGCPIDESPMEVALGFLNNLAFVHGMKPVFQMGAFVGTFGEYDQRVVRSETSPDGDKPHRGGE